MTTDALLAISAGATFLLALAAFGAIWQNYQFHRKEQKERQLKEVIDWATSILEAAEIEYSPEFMLKGLQTVEREYYGVTLKAIYLREIQMYNKIRSKVEYIVNISQRHLNKDDLGILI